MAPTKPIYATRAVIQISSGKNLWLTPPHLTVWIPRSNTTPNPHATRFDPDAVPQTRPSATCPRSLHSAAHSNLFRELVIEAVRVGELRKQRSSPCAPIHSVRIAEALEGVESRGLVTGDAAQLSPNNRSKGAPETRSGPPKTRLSDRAPERVPARAQGFSSLGTGLRLRA